MPAPTLADLPTPPSGKTGWPWTESSALLPDRLPDGRSWPLVTIVTPSLNQGAFLEATIRSVLLQGYPNIEYIVVDGGSTDGSVEILTRYERWLAGWVSEADGGQSDAVNKGFAKASGEIFGWLNSDDLYEANALAHVGRYFAMAPGCALLYGRGSYVDAEGLKTGVCDWIQPFDRRLFRTFNFILQPATFWRRELWHRVGQLDVSCHWAMDWEWLIRAAGVTEPHFVPVELALWRVGPDIKTVSGGERRRAEIAAVSRRHGGILQPTYLVYLLDRASWRAAERLGNGRTFRLLQRLAAPLRWLLKNKIWNRRYQA
jgi:glycosyltransferase involved in cell wall biosynthesis